MTISVGDQLPDAKVIHMTDEGPEELSIADLAKDKTILLFAVPGAFTPTCTKSHLPGYVDNAKAFYAKGVDAIYCVTVNDVFVADAWGKMIGAEEQDVRVLADASSDFTGKMGVQFDGAPAGLFNRSKRYALLAKNGEITALEIEDNPGVCQISSAEHMLSLV